MGLVTYLIQGVECELVTINSGIKNKGIGTKLLNALKEYLANSKIEFLTVITTNDNLEGLRFYQKRGFVLKQIYPNAVDYSRKIKNIPYFGFEGIPIRDEIELIHRL